VSRSRLTGEQLDRIVAELKQIGLGSGRGSPAVIEGNAPRRRPRRRRA